MGSVSVCISPEGGYVYEYVLVSVSMSMCVSLKEGLGRKGVGSRPDVDDQGCWMDSPPI